jgi:hypothetical protein
MPVIIACCVIIALAALPEAILVFARILDFLIKLAFYITFVILCGVFFSRVWERIT